MYLPDGRVRKLRRSSEDPGCAHEFTFSCYRRLALLGRDRTRNWFIEALDAARRKHDLELWAYVIMPDHTHVLLHPRDPGYRIRAVLQSLKQPVARKAIDYLKKLHPEWLERLRESGHDEYHFWQPGGGYDRNVIRARTAWEMVDYIHANPVRRGLVASPLDWPWSSARWYACFEEVVLAMDGTPP